MVTRLLLSIAFLSIPVILPAQRCAGRINFVLHDARSRNKAGALAQFVDTNAEPYSRAFTSRDSSFTVTAIGVRGGFDSAAPLLMKPGNQPYVELRTGCGGNYDLIIIRRQKTGGGSDTMRISFINACDADFGTDIVFRPGHFTLLVCDTTRIPVPPGVTLEGYRYRPLSEQYPGIRNGGRDLTAALEQAIKKRRGK